MMKKTVFMLLLFFSGTVLGAENLKLLISPKAIAHRVKVTAAKVDKDYQGEEITVIMVMKGALYITSDLIRALQSPTVLEYVKAKSTENPGQARRITISGIDNLDITGKNVLLVDDVFDTGNTITSIIKKLKKKRPKSLKSLVLFAKSNPQRTNHTPDYVLFTMDEVLKRMSIDEKTIVVGYGLDYREHYRGLPGLYMYNPKNFSRGQKPS